jgi:O-antigen/teichoic acid export membrane protein
MTGENLGIYAVQSHFTNTVLMLPSVVATVIYPRIMESYGKEQTIEGLKRYLTQPTLILGYLGCPVLGVVCLSIHLPIQWLLPKYIPAILPGQILIISSFFMIIAYMPGTILFSLNKQKLALAITAVSVLVGAVADYIMIKSGQGIVGVALGTSLSFVLYSILIMVSSLRALKMSIRESISFLLLLCIPYVILLALIGPIYRLFIGADTGWVSDLAYTGIRCGLIVVLMAVSYLIINRRFHVFRRNVPEAQVV